MDSNPPETKNLSSDSRNDDVSADLSPEEQTQIEEEWRAELAKTEEEIQTLRQVLAARQKHAQELKRKLGIGPWREITTEVQQGLRTVQETTAYQKTSESVKLAAEKTTDIFGSFTSSLSKKLGDVKNSSTFKSIEEKVGSAVVGLKAQVPPGVFPSSGTENGTEGDVNGSSNKTT